MAKKKDSEIKKKQLNFLDFLKYLTNYLTNKNRNTEHIIQIINKYKVDKNFVINRLISYNYNKPHIIFYINKYLNNKYEYYNYDLYEYLLSVTFIMDQHNQKRLFFLKSKDLKDPNKYKVKKVLKDYYLTVKNKYLNDDELNYLYSLFCQKVISSNDIEKINSLLNGPDSKIKLDLEFLESQSQEDNSTNEKQLIDEYIEYFKTRPLSQEIQNFSEEIKNEKSTRSKCQDCKLFEKQMVVLDTNRESIGPVDFMFIALNPERNDSLYNKPLVGDAGKLNRGKMYYFDKRINWLITNIISCSTNSQKEIGKNDKQIMNVCYNCQEFLYKIVQNFPAKIYVPIGKQAIEFFGVTGSVTQNSGQITKKDNGSIIVPMIHPSAVLQNKNINTPIYDNTWDVIFQISSKLLQKKKAENISVVENIHKDISQPAQQTPKDPMSGHSNYNLVGDKYVSVVDNNLTYFDSINLDNQNILNIYIDQHGEKKYKLESFNIPIYIKDSSLENRTMLSSEFDYVSYIDGRTRYRLSKTLKDNLIKHKQMAIQKN